MKNITRPAAHYSIKAIKRVLRNNPRAKDAIRRVLRTQLGVTIGRDVNYQAWLTENFPDFIAIAKLRRESESLRVKPLISVIIPTYNTDELFLRDCLDSVISQVYENWELCIVDDASTDQRVRNIIEDRNNSRVPAIIIADRSRLNAVDAFGPADLMRRDDHLAI